MTARGLTRAKFVRAAGQFGNDTQDWKQRLFGSDGPLARLVRSCVPLRCAGSHWAFMHKTVQEFCLANAVYECTMHTEIAQRRGVVAALVELLQERSKATNQKQDGSAKLTLSQINSVRGDLAGKLLLTRLCLDAEAASELVDGLVDWVHGVASGALNRMPLNREVQSAPATHSI